MDYNRVKYMYGNKPPMYAFSVCVLCFWIGWLFAQYNEIGISNFLFRAMGILLVVHIMDACIKSYIFIIEHFRISCKLKVKE